MRAPWHAAPRLDRLALVRTRGLGFGDALEPALAAQIRLQFGEHAEVELPPGRPLIGSAIRKLEMNEKKTNPSN
jgi:hypothetical protein